MYLGYAAIVLHAHLPYVRHPEADQCLEELWLMEAITETYLPLVDVMRGLLWDQVPFRLTMSITPTLAWMLSDEYLQGKYRQHIDKLCELAEKEVHRTRHQPPVQEVALSYLRQFRRARQLFEDCRGRLLDCFVELGSSRLPGGDGVSGNPRLSSSLICQSQGCRSSNSLRY